MTRLYGWAEQGQRLDAAAPHGHWQTTTMLSAIRCAGVIEQATLAFDGATNATIFRGYVERCLAPALKPGEIVVHEEGAGPFTARLQADSTSINGMG